MPITLDADLDPSLYPLAWLVGSWRGTGAVQLSAEDGEGQGRRIEQELSARDAGDGTLAWSMRTWVLDAPPPLPPTSVFANGPADPEAEDAAERSADDPALERRLLISEKGTWRVLGPVPGQDLEAAAAAKPGSPAAIVSYQLEASIEDDRGTVEVFAGEVRGPRIQLAADHVGRTGPHPGHERTTRMFGLVGGRLMWLIDRAAEGEPLATWVSAELDRA